jgi:hypothetical protein
MRDPDLTGAEAVAASAIVMPAAAIVAAYIVYRSGRTIAPFAVLPLSIVAGACTLIWLWRRSAWTARELIVFAAIVGGVFAWLLRVAWPDLLPPGGGPDLTHHLVLIDYIERHWHLARRVVFDPYLGDMVHYTPGSHLLVALTGVWTRTDGLHALYPVVALTVALKSGLVFLVAHRLVHSDVPRAPIAMASVLLLFLPRAYWLGSFTENSFIAQVIGELFAVAMWWALVVWEERSWAGALALFGLVGMATFLTWPVWIGPPLVAFVALLVERHELSLGDRSRHLIVGVAPIAFVAALHIAGRVRWLGYAATSGAVLWPSMEAIGWPFLVLSLAGLAIAARMDRADGRTTLALLGAIAIQATALYVVAREGGADTPYIALKMMYLVAYPLAVVAVLAIAAGWRAVAHAVAPALDAARGEGFAWMLVGLSVLAIARSTPRIAPVITQPTFLAGVWARQHVPPDCVDYLVRSGYTAYWLHLAVLRNPRTTARVADDATFEPRQAIVRWIYPNGLTYAITDDFEALPRDIRNSVDVLVRTSAAAVVQRRGVSSCPAP